MAYLAGKTRQKEIEQKVTKSTKDFPGVMAAKKRLSALRYLRSLLLITTVRREWLL
jgi:hypothetical protein